MNNRGLLRKRNRDLSKRGDARLRLDTWLRGNPDLATAYYLKEEFFAIYDFVHRHDAERALDKWRYSVSKPMREHFGELLSATKNWRAEILEYFDHREVTNAFTESLNSITRVTDRLGRGYDFEVLRGRLLFGRQRRSMNATPSARELRELASTASPAARAWLETYSESRRTGDIQLLEECNSAQDVFTAQDGLVRKYGNLCPPCGGKLDQELLQLYRSLPAHAQAVTRAQFHLVCTQCGKPFSIDAPEPPFQPAAPESPPRARPKSNPVNVRSRGQIRDSFPVTRSGHIQRTCGATSATSATTTPIRSTASIQPSFR